VDLHHTKDPDFTWVGARFGYLSTIELNAGIVVACLMTLKPLVNRVFPSMFAAPAAGPALTGPTPPTIGGTPPVLWKGSSNEAQSNDVAPWELEAQTSKAEGESKGTPSTSSS
jgi:hypothetical protein